MPAVGSGGGVEMLRTGNFVRLTTSQSMEMRGLGVKHRDADDTFSTIFLTFFDGVQPTMSRV